MSVRPAKTQISLGIRPVWSESSLCAQSVAKDLSFLHADSEDSDQTGRMPRLIWVFAGRTAIWLVLSCRGSIMILDKQWVKDSNEYSKGYDQTISCSFHYTQPDHKSFEEISDEIISTVLKNKNRYYEVRMA